MFKNRAESFASHFVYFVKNWSSRDRSGCGGMVIPSKIPGLTFMVGKCLGFGKRETASEDLMSRGTGTEVITDLKISASQDINCTSV